MASSSIVVNGFVVTFLALQALALVLRKRVSIGMQHYAYVLTLSQPLCTTTSFGILSCALDDRRVWQRLGDRFHQLPSSDDDDDDDADGYDGTEVEQQGEDAFEDDTITVRTPPVVVKAAASSSPLPSQSSSFPMANFALLGFLFTSSNFLLFTGSRGEYLPGPVIILLQQLVIPITSLMAFVFLGTRYKRMHLVGALTILAGICVSLYPSMRAMRTHNQSFWAAILVIASTIPESAAICVLEHSFKRAGMPIFFTWCWLNVFEFLLAIPLVVVFLPVAGIPLSHTWTLVSDGYTCLLGGDATVAGDECNGVGWWFLAFVLVLVANKSNQGYLLKNTSSTIMWMAASSAVPLAELLFSWHVLMGSHVHRVSWEQWVGCALVFVGLVTYRLTNETHALVKR